MWLLAANFKVNVLGNKKGGWTHGPMEVVQHIGHEPDLVLLIVKHPLTWLPSIYRYRGKGAFPEYVASSKEIELWNERYRGWLDASERLCKAHFAIIRYEEALEQKERLLEALCGCGGLLRKGGPWRFPQKHMGKHMSETNKPFRAEYYLGGKYMNTYPRRTLREVRKRVDQEILERLGYGRMK